MNKYSLIAYNASRYPKDPSVVPCEDVSFVSDPMTLRKVAEFLQHCADKMDQTGEINADWHIHFRDWLDDWQEDMIDLVVCSSGQ